MSYLTIDFRLNESIGIIRFKRPEANNSINDLMIKECLSAVALCEESATIVVIEGAPEVFCVGADFREVIAKNAEGRINELSPEPLYDLWLKLATGSFVTVAHVRGKTTAGGVGFVAASDIVLANESAQFGLSELLFGLTPAYVLPFLIRRIGFQRAHFMTLSTQSISVQQALEWGLVDAYETKSEILLRRYVNRFRRLTKAGVSRYKIYVNSISDGIYKAKTAAMATSKEAFTNRQNLESIGRYIEKGLFPWTTD
jgi:polyketide biosynthesis enoyl-CoA hydratase PksH